MAVRIADAMRRGALCHDAATGSDSIDFLRIDWFEIAHLTVGDARHRFGVTPRSPAAIAAGSRTPWEPGGISEYQQASGQAQARRDGRTHDSFGAAPRPDGTPPEPIA